MDYQDLLVRAREIAASAETLDGLLRQLGAAGGEGSLAPGAEVLMASAKLTAASQATRDALASSSQALAAATRGQRKAHREQVGQARAAVARSRALLGRAGQEDPKPERPPAADRPLPGLAAVAPLLAKLQRHGELAAEEEQALAAAVSRTRHVPAGTELAREGSSPTESLLLLEGFAARCKVLREGGRQITDVHVPGDFVDLHSFLLKPMDHAVAALTPCTVAVVPHEALRQITDNHPHLSRLLWLGTLVDGAVHREWLVAMGRRTALGHLSHLLCEMFLRLEVVGLAGVRPDGVHSYRLPLTQADVGDALGLSVVHVNRTLRELREQGLAAWRSGAVSILDWDRLVEVAEFSPAYLHLGQEPH